jgi:hypothetical protein
MMTPAQIVVVTLFLVFAIVGAIRFRNEPVRRLNS